MTDQLVGLEIDLKKDETRSQILEVASMLFAQKGFNETSMNDIVHASGLSKGGIYWHFKSKNEIVLAIFNQYFDMELAMLNSVLASEGTSEERLRRLIARISAALDEPSDHIPSPIDFYNQALRDPALLHQLQHYFQGYRMHFKALIQAGIDAGEFTFQDADTAALALISSLEGAILIATLFSSMEILSSQLISITDLFLKGLR